KKEPDKDRLESAGKDLTGPGDRGGIKDPACLVIVTIGYFIDHHLQYQQDHVDHKQVKILSLTKGVGSPDQKKRCKHDKVSKGWIGFQLYFALASQQRIDENENTLLGI